MDILFDMVRLRVRQRQVCNDSQDTSFESIGSGSIDPTINTTKLTVDTSSLTSCDTSQDELLVLRSHVKSSEKREEQLRNDIMQLQKKLEGSEQHVNHLKEIVYDDVRPGSGLAYRKEIALLKQELNKRHDDLRDRDLTIENLMVNNHPNHSFLVENPMSLQSTVSSSLQNESPNTREMKRLLDKNTVYNHQLRSQGGEVEPIRRKLSKREKERIDTKEKLLTCEENRMKEMEDIAAASLHCKQSAPFDPFQAYSSNTSVSGLNETGDDSPSRIRKMNDIIVKQKNEINKRDSVIFELEKFAQRMNETDIPFQEREIKDLKKALNESLIQLENAADVMTEQRKTIHDLEKLSSDKEANYAKLKCTLQEKDSKIEELSLVAERVTKSEREMTLRDKEIEDLQEIIVSWKARYADLNQKYMEKEVKIDKLPNSVSEFHNVLEDKKSIDIAKNDDSTQIHDSLKEENKFLIENASRQTIQLQQAGKMLTQKEDEKSKLEASLKKLQVKLDIIEAENIAMKRQTEINGKKNDTAIVQNDNVNTNFKVLTDADGKEKNFLSTFESDNVQDLQNRIELIATKSKDQQYEMDILLKNFSRLSVQNKTLKEKCKIFAKNIKFYADEVLGLLNLLVGKNFEVKPFKNYIEILLEMQSDDFNDLATSNLQLNKFESSLHGVRNELDRLSKAREAFSVERTYSEQDVTQEDDNPSKLAELLRDERKEKEEIICQRDSTIVQLQAAREELKAIEGMNKRMEKNTMLRESSFQKLFDKVERRDAKIAELEKHVFVSNTLKSDNANLREKNAHNLEKIDILLLEIQELKEELSNSIKSHQAHVVELEEARILEVGTGNSYEHQIAALRKELALSRSQYDKCFDALKTKDDRIRDLERTLHAQEKTVDSLLLQLSQAQHGNKQQDSNFISAAKQRLEQLKVVNAELKEENVKLAGDLERALTKIERNGREQKWAVVGRKELKQKIVDLDVFLKENDSLAKHNT